MSRAQLNTRIATGLKKRVGMEAVKSNTTRDIVVEVALENLFSGFSPGQRASFYAAHNRRPYLRAA